MWGAAPIGARVDAARRRVGRRGQALLVFGFVDFVFGFSLIDATSRAQAASQPSYLALQDIVPLAAWGWLWIVIGVVCVFYAFARSDAVGFGAAIGIKVVWTSGLLASWLIYDAPRAWVGAALWVVVARMVVLIAGWPEPVDPEHAEELEATP